MEAESREDISGKEGRQATGGEMGRLPDTHRSGEVTDFCGKMKEASHSPVEWAVGWGVELGMRGRGRGGRGEGEMGGGSERVRDAVMLLVLLSGVEWSTAVAAVRVREREGDERCEESGGAVLSVVAAILCPVQPSPLLGCVSLSCTQLTHSAVDRL